MIEEVFSINASDGTRLDGIIWIPEVEFKAGVCLVHGIGEHCGRYRHVAEALCKRGIGLLGMDLRGHGKSQGSRGHIGSFDKLMEDIRRSLSCVGPSFGRVPAFLYGHSMGGNIVANFLARMKPEIEGAIITSPWLKLKNPPSGFLVALGRFMNSTWPSFRQSVSFNTSDLCRDKNIVKEYENDPLVHNKVTARTGISLIDSAAWVLEHAKEIKVPLLMIHGSADNICDIEGTKEFAAKLKVDHELKIWDGMFHETHNEIGKAEVIEFLANWVEARAAATAKPKITEAHSH